LEVHRDSLENELNARSGEEKAGDKMMNPSRNLFIRTEFTETFL